MFPYLMVTYVVVPTYSFGCTTHPFGLSSFMDEVFRYLFINSFPFDYISLLSSPEET